jgi:hypothetical protein
VQATLRRRLPWPSPPQGAWLQSVWVGPDRSAAVPRHGRLLRVGRAPSRRYGCQTLRRRRQRHRRTGPRLYALAEPWLPTPPLLHPYPAQRWCVTTRGRSPVRSCRTPGSGRGASGNWRPYRDRQRRGGKNHRHTQKPGSHITYPVGCPTDRSRLSTVLYGIIEARNPRFRSMP